MVWIILALTLGAAIMSIIHGVFMLFGSLAVSGSAMFGIPSTMLAALPVISAVFALIGGIIAFNRSKWGILFLLIAVGLCAPSRDTWLYGGIYFFAAFLCFFIKKQHDEFQDVYYEENNNDNSDYYYSADENENENSEAQDYYEPPAAPENSSFIFNNPIGGDVEPEIETLNEPPKLRRRVSKYCPTCGAIVARESRFCPTCGTALFVMPDAVTENTENTGISGENINNDINIKLVNEQLMNPVNNEHETEYEIKHENENDGDEMSSAYAVPNYKVLVKPASERKQKKSGSRLKMKNDIDEAASSYKEFSKYTRRAKKRKRSAGRRVLSMLLLVSAVGGALYFLLGLRKLPPGDLPPIVRDTVIEETKNNYTTNSNINTETEVVVTNENVAEPVNVAVAENILPSFTPERNPKTGIIVGSNVNVREDHSTSSNRVTRLNVNSRIEILGNFDVRSGQYSGIWYNIRTNGREGWVYGRYVQPLGSGLPEGYSGALLRTFGNNKSDLITALGQPNRSSNTSAEWSGLTATLKGENITRIRLNNSSRELQNGLKVGMSQTALYQILGYPSSVSNRIMQYNENGKNALSVQLDRNNSISLITVNDIAN